MHAQLDAVIVAERKFVEVALEVLLPAVLIAAVKATLEHAKEALNRVRGHIATGVFLLGVDLFKLLRQV